MSAGYEKKDVNIAKLIGIGIAIVVFIVVSLIFLNEYFLYETEEVKYQEVLAPQSITLEELHAKEDTVLNSYQLIDSTKGIYSIPIDSAMKLYVNETQAKSK